MRSKLTKIFFLAFFASGIFLGLAAESIAWEKGNLKIVPWVKYDQQWDSNIFYDRENPQHDWIFVTTPGIIGEFGFGPEGMHKVKADYKVELGAFARFDDQNYGNHDLNTGIALDFDKYTFDVNNRFQFTSDRAGTEFTNRVLRKINTFDAVMGWHFNKIDFDTGYRFYMVDYLSDTLKSIDYYTNEGWITGYVQVAPKTQALLEFNYKNLQYPDASGRNANAYAILTGVRGQITGKVSGTAKIGYKYKDYNSSTQKDYSNYVAGIDLYYDMSQRVDMTFSYYRQPYESTYSNNNYYIGDHFRYNIKYDLGKNFTAILDAFWLHNNYKNAGVGEANKRKDNEWQLAPRLEYKWKEFMVIGGGYKFHQRESNIGSRRYDQHVVNADITLMF
jgi:polysaccharide biosynthesis protein VpsM